MEQHTPLFNADCFMPIFNADPLNSFKKHINKVNYYYYCCARSGLKKLTKIYNKGFPKHSTLINYAFLE